MNKITKEMIDNIIKDSEVIVSKFGDKTTIVGITLPNGFIILESSSCVDPLNFSEEIGKEICMRKIEQKLWELEGYVLQTKLYNSFKR